MSLSSCRGRVMTLSFDIQKVKEEITPSDIYDILEYLGAEPEQRGDAIVSKTVSHGGDSKKLFYYPNTQLFIDYTNGGDRFDVFELVSRVLGMKLTDSIWFVVSYLNLQGDFADSIHDDWSTFDRYESIHTVNMYEPTDLPVLPFNLLDNYPRVVVKSWVESHISPEVQDRFGIRFNATDSSILIPHWDVDGNLVGVRKRALVDDDIRFGKYRPAVIKGELRNHPLAFNLYGIDKALTAIQESHMAIVVESEKSVMQSHTYGIEQTVACCGSSISMYQVNMLRQAGATHVVIGFDRDYKSLNSDEAQQVANRLKKLNDKISPYMRVSFLWDKKDRLGYKDSPFDRGKDVLMELWKDRVVL